MPSPVNGARMGRTDALILLTVVLWAVNLSIIKIGLRSLPPHAFNAVRLSLASAAYLVVLAAGQRKLRPGRRGDAWKAAGLGLLGITGYQLFFIQAIARMNASSASIIMGTSPVFIALLATAVGKERIGAAGWAGIALSFAGFLLVVSGDNGGPLFAWGALRGAVLILLANACWAGYTVFAKPILERSSPVFVSGVGTAFGTLVYLPFAAESVAGADWKSLPWEGWAAILYSGLVAIFLCFILWYISVRAVGSTKTGVYGNLTPVLAIVFAGLFLGERLTAVQAAGAAVTLTGVYLTRSGYRFFEGRRRGQTEKAPAAQRSP